MRGATFDALPVIALVAVGLVLRAALAGQTLFADELSTYWISATHSLGGVLSLMYGTKRIPHAEITPPLYFLLAWLTSHIHNSAAMLRLPSLLAGTLTIPVVYRLGRRVLGRNAALIACALTTFAPFTIYYSAEARAYALMMLLLTCSTLAMLRALDTGRARWWVAYAVCACAAFYSHYTSGFVLLAQFVWLLVSQPQARRAGLIASVGAALGVVPWLPGLIQQLRSPTLDILSQLASFTVHDIEVNLTHWAIGYPYSFAGGLKDLPGVPALILLGLATSLAALGLARKMLASKRLPRLSGERALLVLLAAAAPVGELLVSAAGNHVFGTRNLAPSWPYTALVAALLFNVAGLRVGIAAAALATVAFALGAARELSSRFQRPDYAAAAHYVSTHTRTGDVIVDGSGTIDPGPLTPLDISLRSGARVVRALAPAERDHPFSNLDRTISLQAATRLAEAQLAPTARLFAVLTAYRGIPAALAARIAPTSLPAGPGYHLIQQTSFPGVASVRVLVYSRGS